MSVSATRSHVFAAGRSSSMGQRLGRHLSTALNAEDTRAQRTVGNSITFEGFGLHSGAHCSMTLMPAQPGQGIVFSRTSQRAGGSDHVDTNVRASWDRVIDTTLSTVIAEPAAWGRWTQQLGFRAQRLGLQSAGSMLCGPCFATIEHLMAALSSQRIDNVKVLLSSDEVPVMDGSSSAFTAALSEAVVPSCASAGDQHSIATVVEILRPVSVQAGARSAILSPWEEAERLEREELEVGVEIDFGERIKEGAGGKQSFVFERREFGAAVASARTFCFEEDVESMRRLGLARGGSLLNAVVYDRGGQVLNEGGLRFEDEAARHKALDALGDLALGGQLVGRFRSRLPGHALTHRLLAALFSDPRNYRVRPSFAAP